MRTRRASEVSARRHKAFVVVTDPTWRSFKAHCAQRGRTIEAELGRLVEREVGAARRDAQRSAARSKLAQREIDRLEREGRR
jgi:hypothetical protein